jgi:hypothetical protein
MRQFRRESWAVKGTVMSWAGSEVFDPASRDNSLALESPAPDAEFTHRDAGDNSVRILKFRPRRASRDPT